VKVNESGLYAMLAQAVYEMQCECCHVLYCSWSLLLRWRVRVVWMS